MRRSHRGQKHLYGSISFELAHQGGCGLGRFFDFEEGMGVRAGSSEVIGQDIGVGGNDTQEIVEGMGDDLGLGRRERGGIRDIEGELHLRSLSKMRLSLIFHQDRGHRIVKGEGGEINEGEATRCSTSEGLGVQLRDGWGIDGEDGEGGIFGANFLDVVEALKIPGVDVDNDCMPVAGGKRLEKLCERIQAADVQRAAWNFPLRLRKLGPGMVFAQEENFKYRVLHGSF